MTSFRPKWHERALLGPKLGLQAGLNGMFLGVFHLPRVCMDVRLVEIASDPIVCSIKSCVWYSLVYNVRLGFLGTAKVGYNCFFLRDFMILASFACEVHQRRVWQRLPLIKEHFVWPPPPPGINVGFFEHFSKTAPSFEATLIYRGRGEVEGSNVVEKQVSGRCSFIFWQTLSGRRGIISQVGHIHPRYLISIFTMLGRNSFTRYIVALKWVVALGKRISTLKVFMLLKAGVFTCFKDANGKKAGWMAKHRSGLHSETSSGFFITKEAVRRPS